MTAKPGPAPAKTPVILTAHGSDRPGLVQSMADAVHACGGNWLESHLTRLAGMFVGAVLVDLPEGGMEALKDRLRDTGDKGLTVTVVPAAAPPAPPPGPVLLLDLTGHDRPGIMREVSAVLAEHGVNIQEIATEVTHSPWSGDALFKAHAELEFPDDATVARLQAALEHLSGEIMVDVALKQPA